VTDVYVAASSNVEPIANLRRALDELSSTFSHLRVSPAYRNRAVGFEGDDFVNLVVEFATDPLAAVLERLHAVEEPVDAPAMRRSGRRARWTSTCCCTAAP
jgi:2-amino-4-hydroxy-6-hydroxymethyldihydropteridine diphosphokinase